MTSLSPTQQFIQRKKLLKWKSFLRSLWEEQDHGTLEELLRAASDEALKTVLATLSYLANGVIPVSEARFVEIERSAADAALAKLKLKSEYVKIATGGRQSILRFLELFVPPAFPVLFERLFKIERT